ncbi:hypothetical protein PanWU01x14_323970 [Parasponia andersonii]|uniref:Endonuclease/exonuclease/phosphatase n=1 Tax=Parasponia andersonii TaxID=3476 RepID=A0A2P5AKD4_PARAD|nr:hypothetical protein PanWU01x14_323970 [Parasponia andersonii]
MTRGRSRIPKQVYRPSTKSPKAIEIPTHVSPSNIVPTKKMVTNPIEEFDDVSETIELSQNPRVMVDPDGSKNSIHSLESPEKLSSSKTAENFDLNMIYRKKDEARVDVALFSKIDVNNSFYEVPDDSSRIGVTSKRTRSLTPMLPPWVAWRELWSSLLDIVVPIWYILGDFNVVLSSHEITGTSYSTFCFDFAGFLGVSTLIDLDTTGAFYTKIGRGAKDHYPLLLLRKDSRAPLPRTFHFQNV